MSQAKEIDYVIVGIGHPSGEYQATPFNAGYTFCDYMANCIAMQSILIKTGAIGSAGEEMSVPDSFKKPVFTRNTELAGKIKKIYSLADLNLSEFAMTEADLHQGPKSTLKAGAETNVKVKLLTSNFRKLLEFLL
jgi:hypothetical protein